MSTTLPTPTPTPHRGPSRGRIITVIVVALALAVLVVLVVRAGRTTGGSGTTASATPTSTTSATAPSGSSPGSGSASPTRPSSSAATSAGVPLIDQGYVPLYPFGTLADAQGWQASYRSGGHQPWHLDAGETALSFTRGYLGFTEIDRVVGTVRTDSSGAHVDVGYVNPAGRSAVAATLHLMRFATGTDAPWEVVGSDDTTLTLDIPSYAATITSPVRVGGYITGVDENIVVSVRQLARQAPLATAPGVPAGGQHQPGSVTVAFSGARTGAVTLVASTGGHLQRIERFAITGVRVS